jgi:hypothetical protein
VNIEVPEEPAAPRTDQEFSDALRQGVQHDRPDIGGDARSPDELYGSGPRLASTGVWAERVKADQDVVFRDKISNFYGTTRGDHDPVPLAVAREVVEEVRHAFVAPSGFAEIPSGRRITIIRIDVGRGGGTAAMRLLLDAGAAAIAELAPDSDLRRLSAERVRPSTGLLLRNAGATVLDHLTEFEIDRLGAVLDKQHSWLALTVDRRVRFSDSVLARHICELGEAPAAREVMTIHLRRRLGAADPDGGRTAEILADPTVDQLLAESVERADRVARMASFARILAEAAQAGDFSVERIGAQLLKVTEAGFEAWFDHLDRPTRCFVIALATLPGDSYETVSDAAAALERAVFPPKADGSTEPRDPFEVRRIDRLNAAHARVVVQSLNTRYGATPMEVVRFIDPSLPRQVLNRVWTEYAEIRDVLLEWLRGLATHGVGSVRFGAARAVGIFAVQAFDYVRRHVIEPWAISPHAANRQAAALALTVPAREPLLSGVTRRMLDDWHLDRAPWLYRNTAARAFGHLGLTDPDLALDAFTHLATETGHGIPDVVANSVIGFVVREDEALTVKVMDRLHGWITESAYPAPEGSGRARAGTTPQQDRDDARARAYTACYAFLTAAVNTVLVGPAHDRDGATAWHALLWLADRSPAVSRGVEQMWASVLISPIAHEAAGDALAAWAVRVETDPAGRAAFVRLLADATRSRGGDRARTTVRRLARIWRAGPEQIAPETAKALAEALAEPREEHA